MKQPSNILNQFNLLAIETSDHTYDTSLHVSAVAARDALYAYVAEHWEREMDGEDIGDPTDPEAREEAIGTYFENTEEESYFIEVIDAPKGVTVTED